MRNAQRFNFTEGFDGFGVPDALPQLPISLTYQDSQQRVTFGVVGFRLNNRIEPFSTQYCFAQPNLQ